MSKNRLFKAGFTLVEVAIVLPIAVFIVLALITSSISLINDASTQNAITKRTADIQAALDIIEQDISYSDGFLTQIECSAEPQTLCNGYDVDYDGKAGMMTMVRPDSKPALILRALMTTENPFASRADIELVHQTLPNTLYCNVNPPAFSNIIYYISPDGRLMRKTTINNAMNDTTCTIPWQQNSCLDRGCPDEDMVLLHDAEMEIDFFNASNPTSPIANIYSRTVDNTTRQSMLDEAVSVQIVLRSEVTSIKGENPTVLSGRLRAHPIQ